MIATPKVIKHLQYCVLLLSSLFLCCLGTSCERSGNKYQYAEGGAWNTLWHATYRGDPSLADSIPAVLAQVGKSLNVFDPSSMVSKVNRNEAMEMDGHFRNVWVMSKRISKETQGAFDPTLGPLIRAWGFGPGHKVSSDTARLDSMMKFVGIEKTGIHDNILSKSDPRIEFNFSAIAKGYGCDMVGQMLERNSVTDYLIEIGGEIRCSGNSPKGNDWRISIDRPQWSTTEANHESQQIIAVSDCGIATSGNYRNFIKEGGMQFGHTISSATGRPAATDVVSATVIAPTTMEADGYATAFMAMGSKASLPIAQRLRLPVMLILSDSTVVTTPLFDQLIN